ncbi:MAG TPA: glycosyltransferase family 4 protein, partial [Candidatus Tectomicrobia bacterium]|nr:glycosyltransferase family 4 protein [Candidatus Tectomicrobia bacterium]
MDAVVLVLSNVLGSIGGTQRQADLLAGELASRGIPVVLVGKARGLRAAAATGRRPGVEVRALPSLRWLPAWTFLVSLLIWAALRRRRIGVLHAQSTSAGVIAGIVGRLLGKPVVVKVTEMKYAEGLRAASAGRRLRRWMLRRSAGAVVALSGEMRRALSDAGLGDLVVLIPNGVALQPRPSPPVDRATPTGPPVVLCVGRLTPRKRIDALLAAWQTVDRTGAELQIVGDGPLRPRLEAEARARGLRGVRFLGLHADVMPFYERADVFVLPSTSEGMSNALLEAMAAGLPVVASDIGGNRDIVEHGV